MSYSIYRMTIPPTLEGTRQALSELDEVTLNPEDIERRMITEARRRVAVGLLEVHERNTTREFLEITLDVLLYELTTVRFDPFSRSTSTMSNLRDDIKIAVLKDTLRDVHTVMRSSRRTKDEQQKS